MAKINFANFTVLVDDEDCLALSKHGWYLGGNNIKYPRATIGGKTVYMHQFILGIQTKYQGEQIDHIDGNPLNNQKSNLRVVTRSINNQNVRKYRCIGGTSSQYTGVCFHKRKQLWQAYITKDNIRNYLGYYTNETDAAYAYDRKAREFFGPLAKLNFPMEIANHV